MTGGRGGPVGTIRVSSRPYFGGLALSTPAPAGATAGRVASFGPGGRGRGSRSRRAWPGAATSAPSMLLLLDEQPQNGYQLIQEIERRTEGVWKPLIY